MLFRVMLVMKRCDEKSFGNAMPRTGGDGHIFSNHMVLRKSDESCICDQVVE